MGYYFLETFYCICVSAFQYLTFFALFISYAQSLSFLKKNTKHSVIGKNPELRSLRKESENGKMNLICA